MSLLDKLLSKKQKVQKYEQPKIENIPAPELAVKPAHPGLNLSKEIGLNLKKMNLDDEDIQKKRKALLDVSGSMDEEVHDVRKIDSLRDVMKKYPYLEKICFSNKARKCPEIPEPSGGTNLAGALRFIKRESPLPERIVLISDGLPDSESDAKKAAVELGIPIDIIYIGEEESDGKEFMEELAQLTHGQHFVV